MKSFVVAMVGLLIASAMPGLAAPQSRLSTTQLLAEIQARGARRVLHAYYDTKAWSLSVMPGVRSASEDWLTVAVKLKAVADGAAGEDLDLALYGALANNPFRVLPVLEQLYGGPVDQLCNVSFEAELPKQGVVPYISSIRAKLASARSAADREVAAACTRGLELSLETAKAQGLVK